jgi:hypothetical protein
MINGMIELFKKNIPNGYCKLAINGKRCELRIYSTKFHVTYMAPKPIPTMAKLKYPTLPKYSGSKNTAGIPMCIPNLPIITSIKNTQKKSNNCNRLNDRKSN